MQRGSRAATFYEKATHSFGRIIFLSVYLYFYLFPHFGFEGMLLVLLHQFLDIAYLLILVKLIYQHTDSQPTGVRLPIFEDTKYGILSESVFLAKRKIHSKSQK